MFDINPSQYAAKKARYIISQKITKSIVYLLKECINKLNIQHHPIGPIVMKLENIDPIPPAIHYLHHALQKAMREQRRADAKLYFLMLIDHIYNYSRASDGILISTIGDALWEKFSVKEAIRLAKEDCHQIAEIFPLTEKELAISKGQINKAIALIAQHDPAMFEELRQQVKIIKVFRGKVTMGFTDVRILGAMFIRTPRENLDPILYFFEHIIHEASHIHLNCIMSVDPLILNLPDERFVSPLRNDLRPMMGVFHATYVSARIARALIKLYINTNNQELLHPLAETLDETLRGTIEIKTHAKLTQNGLDLIENINDLLIRAKAMREWQFYDFSNKRLHRFGAGFTKVSALQKAVA